MSEQSAADFLVKTLTLAGIKRIYGIAGDSLNSITEAIRQTESIEWIHVRHEEVAAFAAGAEGQLTGHLTVCAGSCGPGNLHLINGLYDCHRSGIPVLAIAAQIPSAEVGTNYFQETAPEKIFEGCSYYCQVISQAEHLPRILKIAIETAVTKRGVAVIVLPADVGLKSLEKEVSQLSIQPGQSYLCPSQDKIVELAKALNSAKKVTLLAGIGCATARDELFEIASKLQSPIVHSLRGKEHIDYDNPFNVGMTGLLGFSSGYFAMKSCDLLLMLGTDFPYTQFYPDVKTAQIDRRGENIGRRTQVDFGIVGDVKETLRLLLGHLTPKEDQTHLINALSHYEKARKELDTWAPLEKIDGLIHPQSVTRLVSNLASQDAIFTCDVGTPTVWASRYLKMNGQRRLIGSFNHGSMASALPHAIGAQLTYPKRQVISLSGDGGFAMLMGDILTVKQFELPIKIIIFNNSALAFVELEMMSVGLLDTATRLENPDFSKLAESVGIKGYRVENMLDLERCITEALKVEGPAVIDVVVSRLELAMPPHITLDQIRGFGLFGIRAILAGRGTDLLDLAKTALWN